MNSPKITVATVATVANVKKSMSFPKKVDSIPEKLTSYAFCFLFICFRATKLKA